MRRRRAGFRRARSRATISSRSPRATTSSRASSSAAATAGRSRTARSAAPTSARCPRAAGRCWCKASTCHSDAADALLRRFAFLPYARLDDLMVSYAAPGGGVGPHVDSYDVFLLQGFGRRRWRYGRQDDLALTPRAAAQDPAPLRARSTTRCWRRATCCTCRPHIAHDGVAVDACTTYSIGFRAASHTELAQAFLDFLRDELDARGRYADPDLAASRASRRDRRRDAAPRRCACCARIPGTAPTRRASWARYLSEPKPDVYFEPPEPPLSRAAFAQAIAPARRRLDRRTQWLYDDDAIVHQRRGHGVAARRARALAPSRQRPRARPRARPRRSRQPRIDSFTTGIAMASSTSPDRRRRDAARQLGSTPWPRRSPRSTS